MAAKNAETIHVLDRRIELCQPDGGFRTSLDSVMLASACPAGAGETLLDMGCGVGSAGLCVLARVPGAHLTGVDIQEDHVELAGKNAALNDVAACFTCNDIRDYDVESPAGRFDHIICNPPYMDAGAHLSSPKQAKALARGRAPDDSSAAFQDWLDAGFRLLKPGGSFTIIHRADAVDKIINGLGKRFGAVEIIPLWPRAGVEAKRVIVRARKDRKTPARILPGLALHEADGKYTEAADKILRGGEGLFLTG